MSLQRHFSPTSDLILRAVAVVVVLAVLGAGTLAMVIQRSSYVTNQYVVVDQPVAFSHEHHVRGLGIDCRYCHTSAEQSPFAGLPPTRTCMSCHGQIWTNAAMLEPVRESWATGRPIEWNRVHELPDYVYFNHAAHVNKGVGCGTCHGPVQTMPLMYQWSPLTMQWCLDCHRAPEKYLRPREEVWNMEYQVSEAEQRRIGNELKQRYGVRSRTAMESCSTCHR